MIHHVASSFFPEKSAGRATFNLDIWDNMEGGAGSAGGTGPAGSLGMQEVMKFLVLGMRVRLSVDSWMVKVKWQR